MEIVIKFIPTQVNLFGFPWRNLTCRVLSYQMITKEKIRRVATSWRVDESKNQIRFMKHCFLVICGLLLFAGCRDESKDTPDPDPSLVYFMVAETNPVHGDAFILPLKDAGQIAEARQIIHDGGTPIIVAEITKNNNDHYSLNKDLKNNRKWSWHITEFLGFADNTIEILDGWPEYVEDNYSDWVKTTKGPNGKGRIGFWTYSLVREVSVDELYHNQVPE